MRHVPDARLVLFNREIAAQLGFTDPADYATLQKEIVDAFAWTVAGEGEKAERTFMATRYQDSGRKAPGEALGDGRAVWTGELRIKTNDGRILYVDVTMKGVGQTPLAWLNHSDPLHKDGLQSMEEAVHSFLMSEINLRNGLDSTADLAVIELPLLKKDKHTGEVTKAALTVRVGNQTRSAHYRYFSDEPENFAKILKYCVTRDLGLPLGTEIGDRQISDYLHMYATNLAEEAAKYYDLHAVHASPTPGNRTTRGATIDLGTFRYLDAQHGEYTYLFDRLKLANQTSQLKGYLNDIYAYATKAGMTLPFAKTEASALFDEVFADKLTSYWLRRVGLDDNAIRRIGPELRTKFYRNVLALSAKLGESAKQVGGRSIKPAAFEMREVLANTVATYASDADGFWKLFKTKKPWGTVSDKTAKTAAKSYVGVYREILKKLSPTAATLEAWASRADLVGAVKRSEPGRHFYERYEKPILEDIRGGKTFGETMAKAYDGIDSLVDNGVELRKARNLGEPRRIGVISGTFDPPHIGHVDLVRKVKEAYQLDAIYVIPNVTADHKNVRVDYETRKELSILAFGDVPGAILPDDEIEEAFRRGDMTEVIRIIEEREKGAQLFQIMGSDSFERYTKVARRNPVSMILVMPRGAKDVVPHVFDGIPVASIERLHPEAHASTTVRNLIAEGKYEEAAKILPAKVAKRVRELGLYRIDFGPSAKCPEQLFGPELGGGF